MCHTAGQALQEHIDLDCSGRYGLHFSCRTLLRAQVLVVVTFVDDEHFEVVDFRQMGWRAMQKWASSNVMFCVASVLTKM
jgi:hypothetical protein